MSTAFELCDTQYPVGSTEKAVISTLPSSQSIDQNSQSVSGQSKVENNSNDILQDVFVQEILKNSYDICCRRSVDNTPDIFQSLLDSLTHTVEAENQENRFHVDRFKRVGMKIYRLEKLKKKKSEPNTNDQQELKTLAYEDILEELTQDYLKVNNKNDDEENSFVSTPSSYETYRTDCDILSTGSRDLSLPDQKLRQGLNEISKDKSLAYLATEHDDLPIVDKNQIKMKIQEVLSDIYKTSSNKGKAHLTHVKRTFDNCQFKNER